MKNRRILLIVPPGGYYAERWSGGVLMPPLGIGYVAATLEQSAHSVAILDAHVARMTDREIVRELMAFRPDIAGITFTTENRFEAFRTARLIRETLPGCHVTGGGPHASLAAHDTLEGIEAFDSIVVGEGETTMPLLADCLAAQGGDAGLRRIPGLVFRSTDRSLVDTGPALRIQNLDALPFPARHLYPAAETYNFRFDVPGHGIKRFSNLMTSRGCPANCNFCATPKVWGRTVRMRSPENIIAEMEAMVREQGAEAFWFFDDTFNSNPRRVERLCDLMIERGLDRMPWFCEVRVDVMSRELLERMKTAGCYTIGFGVESGSQRILDDVIRKNLKLEKVHELYGWCRELDVVANPFFIISHPTETWEEAQATVSLIRTFKERAHVSMAFLHVYPGTDLEETARRNGTLPPDFRWYQDRNDVKTLASAQGNVPIFLDRLTWTQISDILFEWAKMQHFSVIRKIPKVLRSIRTWSDFFRYAVMGWRYIVNRIVR
ncbi:B12-binding domain-containing radical SAM protein [bacterium]|nr:B12-binding domain-containing radical SAM protein [candidate division CSSED10-310 bacterium]